MASGRTPVTGRSYSLSLPSSDILIVPPTGQTQLVAQGKGDASTPSSRYGEEWKLDVCVSGGVPSTGGSEEYTYKDKIHNNITSVCQFLILHPPHVWTQLEGDL